MKGVRFWTIMLLISAFCFMISACSQSEHDKIAAAWGKQIRADEEVRIECYGEFGDVHVVLLFAGKAPGIEGEETVDGVDFHYNYAGIPLTVWKDSKFYSLQEAFDGGILTHENLVTVRENHKTAYHFMYE